MLSAAHHRWAAGDAAEQERVDLPGGVGPQLAAGRNHAFAEHDEATLRPQRAAEGEFLASEEPGVEATDGVERLAMSGAQSGKTRISKVPGRRVRARLLLASSSRVPGLYYSGDDRRRLADPHQ